MAASKPLKLYLSGGTPNPWKVVLVLNELEVPFEYVEIPFGDVKKEVFTSVNPNGRVPGLRDPNKDDLTLWESGAIIDYLVDVYDPEHRLQYTSVPEKYETRCWEHFQMSGQGPYFGQKTWFEKFHPEKFPSAIERYSNEIKRVIEVIDTHLGKKDTKFLVGDQITYADLMWLPYSRALTHVMAPEIDTSKWQKYTAWLERMYARPAVAKTLKDWDAAIAKSYGS